jgi:hypothetical protein
MEHSDLYRLRETYNEKRIMLCFNGPFSQGLIEEIGNALRNYLQAEPTSPSAAMDVFAAYVEIAQNIRSYSSAHGYADADASATVVISREAGGRHVISAGNVLEPADGEALVARVNALSALDKAQLKSAYKTQLRAPRSEGAGAGLGLIDIARRASAPLSCELRPTQDGTRCFFSLRVVI